MSVISSKIWFRRAFALLALTSFLACTRAPSKTSPRKTSEPVAPADDGSGSDAPPASPEGDGHDDEGHDGGGVNGPPAGKDGGDSEPSVPDRRAYEKDVEPTAFSVQQGLVTPFCVPCHNGNSAAAKLNLEDVALFSDGGQHDYVGARPLTPGVPAASVLVQVLETEVVRHRMPPSENALSIPRPTAGQIQGFKSWIQSLTPLPDEGEVDISLDSDG